ncbi:hypothetical protein [Roseomonas sp. KE2513]|nr:hypothetical protein [Roseomonas sp. KE2513]
MPQSRGHKKQPAKPCPFPARFSLRGMMLNKQTRKILRTTLQQAINQAEI